MQVRGGDILEGGDTSEPNEGGRHIRGQKRVLAPSAEEQEAHMRTHIPYRRWCEFCVRGRCENPPHKRNKVTHRQVPIIPYDYMQQKTKEGKDEGIKSLPILVGVDHDTGWVSAYVVAKKDLPSMQVGAW